MVSLRKMQRTAYGYGLSAILLTGVIACGSDEAAKKDEPDTSDSSYGVPNLGKEEKDPAKVETNSFDPQKAYFLASKQDLYPCDKESYRTLVFVEEDSTFLTCSKDQKWEDVTSKIQAKTVAAKDGVNGKDGTNGVNGKDGKNGVDGRDAPHIGPDEWEQPVSEAIWFLGGNRNKTQGGLCPAGSRFPTTNEVADAILSGLYERFGSTTNNNANLWVGPKLALYVGSSMSVRTGEIWNASGFDPNAATTYYRTACIKE